MVDLDQLGPRIILSFAGGKVFVTETTLLAIIVAVILSAVGIWLGHGLKKVPHGKQVLAEKLVGWVYSFAEDKLGKENAEVFAPYLGTLIIFLIAINSTGLLGLRPITADINITAGLALVSYVTIQVSSVKKLGFKKRMEEMCDPYPMMLPMKIINDLTLPVTLALRLFGNIFGGMIVVDMWMSLMTKLSLKIAPVPFLRCITVIPLNLFFDIFEPVIQGYIFTILTAVDLGEGMAGPSQQKLEIMEKKRKKKLERKRKRETKGERLQEEQNDNARVQEIKEISEIRDKHAKDLAESNKARAEAAKTEEALEKKGEAETEAVRTKAGDISEVKDKTDTGPGAGDEAAGNAAEVKEAAGQGAGGADESAGSADKADK
ncbi:MAG: F0F1 ATP synthase subunit A [Anaerovoracaceae bacterium]